MSTETIQRYSQKIRRKQQYLQKLIDHFQMANIQKHLNKLEDEFAGTLDETHLDTRELSVISLNDRLKKLKKEIENLKLNRFSNTRAFHLKASLKGIPLVAMYDQLFGSLETKGNFPDILDIDAKAFLYPQDMLALEVQRLLVKTKFSNTIQLACLENFMTKILQNYNHVAYHNFSHGFSVMQMFYFMVSKSPRIASLLSPEMVYTGLIGCISHDLCHRKCNQPARTISSKSRRTTSWL